MAKAKAAAKKKAKDDGNHEDSEDDEYNALSTWTSAPKPQPGSFAKCARCTKQFTAVNLFMLLLSSDSGSFNIPDQVYYGSQPWARLSLSFMCQGWWGRSIQKAGRSPSKA
jgi:hypothetical protein